MCIRDSLRGEQTGVYGVPVGGIARVGRAIALRLLGELAFQGGDLVAAESFIDQASASPPQPLRARRNFS